MCGYEIFQFFIIGNVRGKLGRGFENFYTNPRIFSSQFLLIFIINHFTISFKLIYYYLQFSKHTCTIVLKNLERYIRTGLRGCLITIITKTNVQVTQECSTLFEYQKYLLLVSELLTCLWNIQVFPSTRTTQ